MRKSVGRSNLAAGGAAGDGPCAETSASRTKLPFASSNFSSPFHTQNRHLPSSLSANEECSSDVASSGLRWLPTLTICAQLIQQRAKPSPHIEKLKLEKAAADVLLKIAEAMSHRDALGVQDFFEFPYPVFYSNDVRIVTDPTTAAAATAQYLTDLAANGLESVTLASVETVDCSDERCCLRVTWSYEDAQGSVLAATQNDVYFRSSEDGELKISQLDILVSSNKAMRKYFNVEDDLFNT